MLQFLKRILGPRSKRMCGRAPRLGGRWRRSRWLAVERLDDRLLPSITAPVAPNVIGPSAPVVQAVVTIDGTTEFDRVEISLVNSQYLVHHYKVDINGGPGPAMGEYVPSTFKWKDTYYPTTVTQFIFNGNGGNDIFMNFTSVATKAYGGAQSDEFYGGSGRDTFYGGDGYDRLDGGGGADQLYGEDGIDYLEGGAGDDTVTGGAGGDTYAFPGTFLGMDTLVEAANVDTDLLDFTGHTVGVTVDLAVTASQSLTPNFSLKLSSATGIENVGGTDFGDTLLGNTRNNSLNGRGGDDSLAGRGGTNTLSDGLGDDYVDFWGNAVGVTYTTGGGNDTVIGTAHMDVLTGSSGNDRLEGWNSNDTLNGGSGQDSLYGGSGYNVINDGLGNDYVDFSDNDGGINYTTGGGNDTVIGTAYNDSITGSSGRDELQGRGMLDLLNGGSGPDRLYGGNDADTLYGDSGDDLLDGGGGHDILYGGIGWDTVVGGAGNDWLEAGSAAEPEDISEGVDYNAHRWARSRGAWDATGMTSGDINQGNLGTCVFLSSLAGAANAGINLANRIIYQGNFTYSVGVYNLDTEAFEYQQVVFDGARGLSNSLTPEDPEQDTVNDPSTMGEFWTLLFQRAYLQMMSGLGEDFKDSAYALYALTGRCAADVEFDDPASIQSALFGGKVVIAANHGGATPLFANDHAYTVLGVDNLSGVWRVTLRNPWGYDSDSLDDGDPEDGIIVINWADFASVFERLIIS